MLENTQYNNVERFFREAGGSAWQSTAAFATISAISNAALLAVANHVGHLAGRPPTRFGLQMLQFAVFFLVFVLAKRHSFYVANDLVESLIANLRTRITDKLRRTELRFAEKLDLSEIYAELSSDIGQLSQNLFRVMQNFQSALLIVASLVYMAFISLPAMLLSATAIAGVVLAHTIGARRSMNLLHRVNESEARLFGSLHSLFYGFKEVKLNSTRNDALFGALAGNSQENKGMRAKAGMIAYGRIMRAEVAMYALLGTAVFVLPQYVTLEGAALSTVITLVLFLLQPTRSVSDALYNATFASATLERMYGLEGRIDAELERSPPPVPVNGELPYRGFQRISFEDLCFTYRDGQGNPTFSVGPLNMHVERGEILFLVGGNGSGKSTTFKLMTGLYKPDEGRIRVDGEVVPWSMIAQYRQMMSAIYGDFYLFDRLYGLEDVSEARVASLLHRMRLEDKVTYSDGRFSTRDLSTGQRKRLALITSLMEDREIYFLDEWAADQDKEFRDYFYNTLLPDFKQQGKTVVAITHHHGFLESADRVVQLDLGRIASGVPADDERLPALPC